MDILLKVYLPNNLYKSKENQKLYGRFIDDNNEIVFYIIETSDKYDSCLNFIGIITDENEIIKQSMHVNNNFIHLTYDSYSKNLMINSVKFSSNNNNVKSEICLILYDKQKYEFLSKNIDEQLLIDKNNEFIYLGKLINDKNNIYNKKLNFPICFKFIVKLYLIFILPFLKPFGFLLRDTALSTHFHEWNLCLKQYDFFRGKLWTILFDMLSGCLILLILWYYGNPGEYFIKFTILIVKNVRKLLDDLKGSPAGLKLNSQLNEFLLKCFKYHIDLWATFLQIVLPAIHYLFIPLGIVGIFGLSFQLAVLSDLLILVTLHAHCFYIYAALLYRIEIIGLKALWRVMLGRRFNVLKNRVESYEYQHRQLYLATMFFAGLLFLLPTIAVYYVVFASLRLIIYCITYMIMKLRRKILILPIYSYYHWLRGTYATIDNIQFKVLNIESKRSESLNYSTLVIELIPKLSFPCNSISDSKIFNENPEKNILAFNEFFMCLVRGEMMGFITPKQSNVNKS